MGYLMRIEPLLMSWWRCGDGMPKREHHPYFTDGKRLLRLEFEISGGRGVVMEDASFDHAEHPLPGQILSLSVKEFMALKTLAQWEQEQREMEKVHA